MDLSKIIRLVAVLVAVILSFVDLAQGTMIIAVLGLVAGYFVSKEDAHGFLVAAIALGVCNAALVEIPVIGAYLTAILGSLSALYYAGACTVIVVRLIDRIKP
jgi:hypothetical protein